MPYTISATALGELAMSGLCYRCVWIKMKSSRLPYQSFPGIFSTIDRYVKRMVHTHFEREGKLPRWYPRMGDVIGLEEVPHYSKFTATDFKSGVTLRGEPDDVLRLRGSAYHIVDYKTARLSTSAQGMFPRYGAQLNAYAYIAARHDLSPVTGLSLIYLDPETDIEDHPKLLDRSRDEFLLGFTPRQQDVELKPVVYVEGLLARAAELYALDVPPAGKSGCRDCQALEMLIQVADTEEDILS